MPYLLERRLPEEISIARLHGEACIGCGATGAGLPAVACG
ncbi:hypothetical protein ABH940_002950 [Streptacidiphilus sp. BW17]